MSTNQSLKPLTAAVNASGHLEIGGCDTVELAKKFGTPLYVIDKYTIESVCRDYKNAFKSYPKIRMMYASKALCTIATTQLIAKEGFGFDVVSGGELFTVYKAGVDMSKVLFNGNNKSFDELSLAIDLNTGRISVDNFTELEMLNEIALSKNKTVKILLRITPGIECHTHEYIQTGHLDSKFGFDLTQIDDAVELILKNYKNLELTGLHAHIGSQIFETKIYSDEVEILVKEIARLKEKFALNLYEINLGGGLGVKYTEFENPPSVDEIANVIITSLNNAVQKYAVDAPFIYIEPGRSIISTSGVTLYTVGSQKQVPHGTKYVSVDGGMADNPRPAMYQAEYTCDAANKMDITEREVVTIAGRYCESGDILIKDISLPPLNSGDILCVYNTGAYNYSMASNYNRNPRPAIVFVEDGKARLVVKRESYEDMIRNEIL